MGVEFLTAISVNQIDAKGRSDLVESMDYLVDEGHLLDFHFATVYEVDAAHIIRLIGQRGFNILRPIQWRR